MSRAVEPLASIERRLPEAGRIRFGEKGPKGEPRKLDVFRFTSHDRQAIEEIAALYGGVPHGWDAMPGQWQVITTAKEIPIVLPPDPLGDTPVYELWSGGGVLRRCDGETCMIPTRTSDGAEMVERSCVCVEQNKLECKPKTRLTVLLPEIRFIGGWRLESGGWNVAHELPGMVDMIAQLQERGLMRASLALEPRTSKMAGQTRRFVVPVLRPAASLDAILAGDAKVRALAKAPAAEPLQPLELTEAVIARDDEVVDAEIVEESGPDAYGPVGGDISSTMPDPGQEQPSPVSDLDRKRRRCHALLRDVGMGVTERHALVKRITNGTFSSLNDLDDAGLDVFIAAVQAIRKAEAFFDGVDENGMAIVTRR